MSDPVSNHDIEDVLSSIRRLVAQGDPKSTAAAAPEPTVTPVKAPENNVKSNTSDDRRGAGRLVLTPAFRVADPIDADDMAESTGSHKPYDAAMREPESDVIPTKDSRPIPAPEASPAERASLEATIAELEAAVNSRDGEFEPDGSEVQAETSLPSAFLHKLDAVKLRPRVVDDVEDDVEIDPQDEDDMAEDSAEGAVAAAVTDHISEAVASQIADAFPRWNAANEGPQAEDAAQDVEIDDVAEAPAEAVVIEMPREEAAEPEAAVVEEVAAEALKAEVEAVEPADAPEMLYKPYEAPSEIDETIIAPTFRHTAFSEVYDPVAEATADAAEAAADAGDIYGDELAPDPEEPQTAVATPQATPLMDPDMLRDMVGQMIREELQGEMGERITRNVRKLVRREINRVISSQDFQ